MKQILNQGLVLFSELKPLTTEEKTILTKIRNKKRNYFFSTLVVLILILGLAFISAYNKKGGYGGLRYSRYSEDTIERIKSMAPWLFLVVLIGLLIYFLNYYRKLVLPYIKDLKIGKKEIFYYSPEKYQTPLFAEYYITTPLIKKYRIKVNKEIFDEIDPASKASVSVGQYSRFVFEIEVDGRKINFNETSEPVDV
jgi:hypothetical protein